MGEILGNYELTRHLATGGMAEIWIAKQSGAGGFAREIAIKRILPHLAREPRFVDMFFDEARIASALRHPNIVQIYELGEAEGEYFIAMEYIEGADLADLLDEAEDRAIEFPIAISVRIIADVLAALDFAHEFKDADRPLKIVHRDVSPHNVLIGTDGIIKHVDFGIAHAVERHAKTETGLVKGKLSYMAPEQVEQSAVDRRADIFACGVLLYELLTLKAPFGRELAAVSAILHDDPDDPRLLRPEIPEELTPIIMKALEKDPADRYQTAQEMLEDLESVLRSFDKYVNAKHVARFAERLLAGKPIEGYDDVSQALPRSMGHRAFVEATTQLDTPAGFSGEDGRDAAAKSEQAPRGPQKHTPMRRRQDLSEEEVRPSPLARWAGPAFGVVVVGSLVAIAIGMFVTGDEASSTTRDGRNTSVQATEASGQPVELQLEPQYLDEGGEGFEFVEGESELAELETAVGSLSPGAVDRMLLANYERSDEDYLWSVRGPHLLGEFTDPPGPVDPGDPSAPFLLGLEKVDASAVASPRKKERSRRTPRRRKPQAAKLLPTDTKVAQKTVPIQPANTEPPDEEAKPAQPPAPKPTKRKQKKRNDLRIIDKAVPY